MSDSINPPRVVGTPEPDANADNDPELAALLDFEPVPRKVNRPDGWTPERQRRFIELIVVTGSPQQAAAAMRKQLSGIEEVYRDDEKGEFRAAWDGVCELVRSREEQRLQALGGERYEPPHRRIELSTAARDIDGQAQQPGQALNEYGEWEDEESLHRRAEEARDNIARKLLMARRLYLREISGSAGKRAAFEILTDLPVDWEKAKALEPQPDEPWRGPNMRRPDMLMTAENGWMADIVGGPEDIARHKAKVRAAIDEYHAERGMPPVDWESDDE